MKLLLFLTLSSCSFLKEAFKSAPPQKEVTLRELWVGKSVEELDLHPVYTTLNRDIRKSSKGIEIRTFRNSGGQADSGYVGGYGYSGRRQEIVCNHIFHLKNETIIEFRRVGACTEQEESQFAPQNNESK